MTGFFLRITFGLNRKRGEQNDLDLIDAVNELDQTIENSNLAPCQKKKGFDSFFAPINFLNIFFFLFVPKFGKIIKIHVDVLRVFISFFFCLADESPLIEVNEYEQAPSGFQVCVMRR